jgi:nickel/cobalt exporter
MTKTYFFSKYGLLVITALFLGSLFIIWKAWPSLIMSSMQWQKEINNQLSDLLYEAQNHIFTAGSSLILLSFIYGILHSLGPGHGKLIVSTYVATHPTKIKISLMLTALSALLQAVVAITLVSVLLTVFNSSMREVNGEANRLVSLSFYIVIILGAFIVWRNASVLLKTFYFKNKTLHINNTNPLTKNVVDSDTCSCGHVHFASADVINNASSFKEYLVVIFSVGLRPCTGAIMVLLFANMLDIYWLGIISAFVMAMGTAFTTSIIAMMTVTGKQLVKRYIEVNKAHNHNHNHNHDGIGAIGINQHFVYTLIKLTGGSLLILIGAVLLSSQPVGLLPIF